MIGGPMRGVIGPYLATHNFVGCANLNVREYVPETYC
jgi:hypothetical protein